MNCDSCYDDFPSESLCRWRTKKLGVRYVCAACCHYCSDDRHSSSAEFQAWKASAVKAVLDLDEGPL